MRKTLEAVSVGALAFIAWVTVVAFIGPHQLPSRVPVRFNLAGKPIAWGSPRMLLLLPFIAGALYALITWVSRHPSAFNFPVRVTPMNRARLEAVALDMTAWLKAQVLCLFAWIQVATILSARHGHGELSPALMPVAIGVIFATIGWHIVAMFRTANAR